MIKKTYRKALIIILTFISTNVFAQSDEEAIKQTINNLFDGMRKTDTLMIRTSFTDAPILQTVYKSKETGKTILLTEPLDSFMVAIAKPRKEIIDERIVFDVIKIDGELGMAWTPYKLYIGEKFSHCGVDSFQLIKINGKWKIQYLVDTRRRQGCE
ncbi:MAG: nuclear transport factor 2 family protein [Flavisolibacter sp.]